MAGSLYQMQQDVLPKCFCPATLPAGARNCYSPLADYSQKLGKLVCALLFYVRNIVEYYTLLHNILCVLLNRKLFKLLVKLLSMSQPPNLWGKIILQEDGHVYPLTPRTGHVATFSLGGEGVCSGSGNRA